MNRLNYEEYEIIKYLNKNKFENQRNLAEKLDISLGKVNGLLKDLSEKDYMNDKHELTLKSKQLFQINKPERAVILAAGPGIRMIPINHSISKAFLEINNEILIERLIRQLKDAGIHEIVVVAGYMKEEFDYLIDEYQIKLVINSKYLEKNNLYSLYLARKCLENSYVLPCDLYFKENPFSDIELQSWYMLSTQTDTNSNMILNNKHEIVKTNIKMNSLHLVGLSYLNENDAKTVKDKLEKFASDDKYDDKFWEEVLIEKNKFMISGKLIEQDEVYEINTFEQLREIDELSSSLESFSLQMIADTFTCEMDKIKNIECLKKGMTNRSFSFTYLKDKYIMRIPGEGSDQLINRQEEADVYDKIKDLNISDEVIYMNPDTGYKISKYIENARVCNTESKEDMKKCMELLKQFHKSKLEVNHTFDIYEKIEFYESLIKHKSLYKDYDKTKNKIYELKKIVDQYPKEWTLTHLDAVPDNFIFYEENGKECVKLIDWEYAGMQDPHMDIAMFCVYALFEKEQVDELIDIYFENKCDDEIRIKIYCYIATCGFLWSNWCEYKYSLGVEFGEYSMKQYRYAKDYYKYVMEKM